MTRQVQVWGIAAVGKVIYPDDIVVQLYPPGGESPASRLARLQWLFNPTDDNGEALPPFIDKETFMKLINEPEPTIRAWKCDTCGNQTVSTAKCFDDVGLYCDCKASGQRKCDPASLDLVPRADGESNLAGRLAASRLMRDHWEQTAADVLSNVPIGHDGELTPDKFKWLMLKVLPLPPRDVAKLSEQRLFDLAALRDQLGDKDHAIAELHAKVGQLTMERDEALRKAGRR